MNPPVSIDFQTIALWSLGVLMGLLSFLGVHLWNDVRMIKEKWITRDEFNDAQDASKAERDAKHLENTGNFRRVEEKIERSDERHYKSSVAIEKRMGDIAERIAKLRPHRHDGGPERRSEY